MAKHYDSTRTPEARAEALARRQARLTRWNAKADTDAALKMLTRSLPRRRVA